MTVLRRGLNTFLSYLSLSPSLALDEDKSRLEWRELRLGL